MDELTFAQAVRWVDWNRVGLIAFMRRDCRDLVDTLHTLRQRVKDDRRYRQQPGTSQPVTLADLRDFARQVAVLRDRLQVGDGRLEDPPDFAEMAGFGDERFFEPESEGDHE